MPIEPVHNNDPYALTQSEILDCFHTVPFQPGQGGYLVAVGRAIEAKVRAKAPLEVKAAANFIEKLFARYPQSVPEEAEAIVRALREFAA